MMALPFPDASFDLVTTGYGIRNVPRIEPALAEIRRVLRPGGLLLSLDFDRPANPLVRAVYLGYLTVVGSALGWVLHRDPGYLPLHPRIDPPLPRRRGRRGHAAPRRFRRRARDPAARRPDGDQRGAATSTARRRFPSSQLR